MTVDEAVAGHDTSEVATRRRQWIVATLLFLTTALIFTAPGLLPGSGMGGFDIWAFASPFRETLPEPLHINNPMQTDQLEQIPLAAEFWSAARSGEVQLWEPDQAAGIPLLTAVHNRVLAPPNLAYAVAPVWKAATFAVAIALFLAQMGTFALARRFRLGFAGSLLAGVAYGFSGPVTALLLRIHETSMLPWMLLGVHCCFTGRRKHRAILLTAAATAGTMLSGFPAATLHVMYLATALAAWMTWRTYRDHGASASLRGAARTASGAVAGTLIAAPVLLPTAEWLPQTGSIERSYPTTHALGLDRMATAVSGRFFGAPQDHDHRLLDVGLGNPVEASMTMGVVALLALAWLVWRPPARGDLDSALPRFLVPAAVLVLVAVVLGGPALGLIHQLPYMSSNAFGRARFIVSLAVALMAGGALDGVLSRLRGSRAQPRRPEHLLRWGGVIVLVMVIVGVALAFRHAISDHAALAVVKDLLVPTAVGATVLGTVIIGFKAARGAGEKRQGVMAGVLAGVAIVGLCVELQFGAWGFVSSAPRALFYPVPDLPAKVIEHVEPGGGYRFTGTNLNTLVPHSAALMDLSDLRVSYPAFEPWRQLLEAADPGVYSRHRLRTLFTDRADWNSPVLDRLATRYIFHPLRDPLLQTVPAEQSSKAESSGGGLSWTMPEFDAPVRGVAVDVDPKNKCVQGWIDLKADGRRVARRLAREVRGRSVFPVADIDEASATMTMSSTTCDIAMEPSRVDYQLADGPLEVLSTDGTVIYLRPEARPRADLVTNVVRVDSAESVLEQVSRQEASMAVVTEHVDVSPDVTGSATLAHDDPDHVVVQTRSDGRALLVLRDVAAPGWHATIDGRPAHTVVVDHALRGVVVPAGQHEVSFRYWPRALTIGLWLMGAGFVMLVTSTFVLRTRLR